jgi:predicted transposase/invertase (TIGR01784 family)
MRSLQEKYINPFTDFGFKKLFGEEINKDLLLDFLNELLHEEQGKIESLTFIKNEQLGNTDKDRNAIFDLYCTNEKGEKFIVEIQKAKQKFFKDRALFYSTFPIQEQAKQGEWNFELKAIYTIAILDFTFNENNEDSKVRSDIKLVDIVTHKVFYDKFTFIYLEMPKFKKTIDDLESRYDSWLYLIKNLHKLDEIPSKLKEKIFQKVFNVAELAKYTETEYQSYESSLKYYRELNNVLDTAKLEGKIERNLELAKNFKDNGVSNEIISKSTGLSIEEIEKL